ncbi:MAG: DUF4347 domain-containing protein, partial [Cyanobacteria bacterium J06642_2]
MSSRFLPVLPAAVAGNPVDVNQSYTKIRIVFIDSAVCDRQDLVASALPGSKIVLLNTNENGITQIGKALAHYRHEVSSLHIVSHGAPGSLQLGSSQLDLAAIEQNCHDLKRWSNALTEDANILLYGCHVAASQQGHEFLRALRALTGANVAASSTKVGHASVGGNWDLDVGVGQPASVLAFRPEAIDSYRHAFSVDEAFAGIEPIDSVVPGQTGEIKVTVKPGGNVQSSTYNDKSFTVENTGDKRIAAIYFDITDALFPDTVFDPLGLAGDTAFRGLKYNSTGGSGAVESDGADVLVPFYGVGGAEGYEGMLLTFDPNVSGGYDPGEIVKFGVDVDPNSIVGLPKKPVDINGVDPRLNSWDIGGVSGAELINSSVHVLFTDGTTAVGELLGDGSQGGSAAIASQANPDKQVTLTVNGVDAGGSGSYSQSNIQVIVSGDAGDTARVVLSKGFIQPFDYIDPDGNPINLSENFIGSPFPANNAIEIQTVDVVLDGTPQDITSLFDFNAPGGNLVFSGDDKLPIGLVASVVNSEQLPLGPVTDPVYLIHEEAGSNTAPTSSGIADITVDEGAEDTTITLFDIFDDAQDPDTDLTYEVFDNTNASLFTTSPSIDPVTGILTLDYTATGTGTADITVRVTDTEALFVDETFTVTVVDPAVNTAPTTSGIANVTVEEGANDTVIALFDAFDDAQDPDTDLTYEVLDNTNASLFTTAPSINPVTGELTLDYVTTGTGAADITVRATDTQGLFVDTTFTVTVNEATPPPTGGIIRIEAEDYKPGTNGIEFSDTSAANLGGAYRPDEPVDIQATQDVGGGFNVGWIKSGEFLTYDINIAEAGTYDVVVRVATNKADRSLDITVGGQSYTATFGSTGGNQSWQDVVIPGIALGEGSQELRVDMNTKGFNLNYIELVPAEPDELPPTATLDSTTLEIPVGSTDNALFSINYLDNVAVESDTLDNQDIQVTAPDGTVLSANFISANPTGDSASLTVAYSIEAPAGGWQLSDSGTYAIAIQADQILDTSGNPLLPQQFNLAIDVNDSPTTMGVPDVVATEGAADGIVDLFAAFDDAQDADADLTYEVLDNTNPGVVSTAIAGGSLILDYGTTGAADITLQATDTDGGSTETPFTTTVVTPQADDGVIRINAGGGNIYDDAGNLFLADTLFTGGLASDVPSSRAIANTKFDELYLTQRQGGNFSYSIPVSNGFYLLNAHLVDWESTDVGQRSFDIVVEGQSYYDDLDVYEEIKNAFLDGKDTAKVIQGPDKNTTIVANVTDGNLDVNFTASLSDATIAALEVVPLDQPSVLIQESDGDTIVSEDGLVDSYTVVLTAPPTTGDVV